MRPLRYPTSLELDKITETTEQHDVVPRTTKVTDRRTYRTFQLQSYRYISKLIVELLSVKTEHSHILHVCSLSDGSLIVCGKLSDQWRLTQYRLRSFATVHTARLEHRPDGMTEVSLEEKRCLAISYM